jgi:pimeloyl-ACP methyl ester carboxylesterase
VLINTSAGSSYAYTGTRALRLAQRTVVFVHGAANDHSVWTLQSRYFAHHGFNVLAVDLPGHGKTPGTPFTAIADYSAWLVQMLDATNVAEATIVGHSMGSLIALETAARCPDRVEKIVLVGTALPMAVSQPLLQSSKANDHAAFELINSFAHSAPAQLGGNRVPGAWMLGGSMRLMERSAPGALHADFVACNNYRLADLASVTCPVLLVLGSKDQMTPARAARALGEGLQHSQTVVVESSGHSLMSEQPDAVLDALIGFI